MKYRVTLGGSEREIDVVVAPDGSVVVSAGGERIACDPRPIPGGVSLTLDGKVYDVLAGGDPSAMQLASGDARAVAEVVSPRMTTRRKRGGAMGATGDEIRAPMPGRVVKILVGEGQSVSAGDPCVVVEAMKMENELRAPKDATIKKVHVTEGAAVDGQALLVSFE